MIDHCKSEVARGSIYVWGAQGERGRRITPTWIRNMETKKVNADRAIALLKKNKQEYPANMIAAFDCSGLITSCITDHGNLGYTANPQNYYEKCVKIDKSELQPGDFVFEWSPSLKRSIHMGVYVGNGEAIEAKDRDCGVVKTKLDDRNWVRYGRPDFYYTDGKYYDASAAPTTLNSDIQLPDETYYCRMKTCAQIAALRVKASPSGEVDTTFGTGTQICYRGTSGDYTYLNVEDGLGRRGYMASRQLKPDYCPASDAIKAVQRRLGVIPDGIYGKNTADAVWEFQKSHGLTADAIYGPKTRAEMMK